MHNVVCRVAQRRQDIGNLRWSDAQLAILDEAEAARAQGRTSVAATLVARGVAIPRRLQGRDIQYALNLDLGRWYFVFTGSIWDGNELTFTAARNRAVRQARESARGGPQFQARNAAAQSAAQQLGAHYRCAHLLVEPLVEHPNLAELQEYTRTIGWPDTNNVGCLEWDNPNALCCVFCDALLLPSEARAVEGVDLSHGYFRGRHCCMSGCEIRTL